MSPCIGPRGGARGEGGNWEELMKSPRLLWAGQVDDFPFSPPVATFPLRRTTTGSPLLNPPRDKPTTYSGGRWLMHGED